MNTSVFRKLPQLSPSLAQVTFRYYHLETLALETQAPHTEIGAIYSEMSRTESSTAPDMQQAIHRLVLFQTLGVSYRNVRWTFNTETLVSFLYASL